MNDRDDIDGQTALHIACEEDKLKIVKLLCKEDAGWFFKDHLKGSYCQLLSKCAVRASLTNQSFRLRSVYI